MAFSSTALAVASVSVTAPTSNSSTSPIVIVKTRVVVEVSVEVARTVMSYVPAASRSIPPATVTTPVLRIDGEAAARVVVQRVADRIGAVRHRRRRP